MSYTYEQQIEDDAVVISSNSLSSIVPSSAEVTQGARGYQSIYLPVPNLHVPRAAAPPAPPRLPSLKEFDQGVEDLIKFHGHSSPPPSLTPSSSQASPVAHFDVFSRPPLQPSPGSSRDGHFHPQQTFRSSPIPNPAAFTSSFDNPSGEYSGYPSPPPEEGGPHINKKYTTEEGDFIIYAVLDKRQKWNTLTRDFARIFGTAPERTTSGLQAHYYRMNQKIPVWNEQGWLVFEKEEDEEPKTIEIKCRDRAAAEGFGLAQRYPERMVEYHWVEESAKLEARDWGKYYSVTGTGRERMTDADMTTASKRVLQMRRRTDRLKSIAYNQIYD